MSTMRTSTARTGPSAFIARSPWRSSIGPVAVAQRLARARAGLGRRGRLALALRGLGFGRRGGAGLLHELLERQHQEVAAAAVVHHDLARRGEDLAHRVDVDALARHL